MKPSLAILMIVLSAGLPTVRAELPAGWSTNYNDTLAAARTNQQPQLVYFTASWCGPCKLMTRLTLADPAVIQTLSDIGHVAVDIDEHSDLAAKVNIRAVPTFVLLTANGDEVDRATGFQPVTEFLPWLTNGVSAVKAATYQQTLAQNDLAQVDQLLSTTNADSNRLAASMLFDLCAARNQAILQSAVARLKALAERDPSLLIEGLDHPRLATRIQTANILRAVTGGALDVDPWADAASRKKVVAAWRENPARAPEAPKPH